jgi:hypothetical protein
MSTGWGRIDEDHAHLMAAAPDYLHALCVIKKWSDENERGRFPKDVLFWALSKGTSRSRQGSVR